MSENKDVWVVFRGQIAVEEGERPECFEKVNQIVEVVKAHKLSKSYVKLVETPFYHPNISYGDILKVESCKEELNETVAIIEFSGIVSEDVEESEVEGLGTSKVALNNIEEAMSIDKQVKPVILDKYKQGLVYEPIQLVSHGSYKINISYEVEDQNGIKDLREYFNTYDAFFQTSCNKKFGSVGFTNETKFETAVKCLEEAPGVVGCYIAFNPKEFPKIGYSEDLIPKKDEESEDF